MGSVEINLDLNLDHPKMSQVELHSFQNVMTVLYGELQFLEKVFGRENLLNESRDICNRFLESTGNLEKAKSMVANWEEYQAIILGEINEAIAANPVKPAHQELVTQSKNNLTRILSVVEERVREFIDRIDSPGEWKPYSAVAVGRQLKNFLTVVALNSKGRYGIVFDPGRKGENDYLVNVSIEGPHGDALILPPILLDSFRDLTANARKYTNPGGMIESILKQDEAELTLSVSDTGRGIPEDEIEKAVGFGFRGSNTKPSETKGGGFGLTKAAIVCKQFGGRMWIESELGKGSKVTLRIPNASRP